jgi:hypothetical protein
LATLTDNKGRVAKYFKKYPDDGRTPRSSFQVTFSDEAGFRLYTLYSLDRSFAKIGDTATFEANGKSRCTEKIYRAVLKAVKAANTSAQSSHGFTFPTELTEAPSPAKR